MLLTPYRSIPRSFVCSFVRLSMCSTLHTIHTDWGRWSLLPYSHLRLTGIDWYSSSLFADARARSMSCRHWKCHGHVTSYDFTFNYDFTIIMRLVHRTVYELRRKFIATNSDWEMIKSDSFSSVLLNSCRGTPTPLTKPMADLVVKCV